MLPLLIPIVGVGVVAAVVAFASDSTDTKKPSKNRDPGPKSKGQEDEGDDGRENKLPGIGDKCQMGFNVGPGEVRLLGKGNVRDRVCDDGVTRVPQVGDKLAPRTQKSKEGEGFEGTTEWPDGTIVKPVAGPTMIVWGNRLARYPSEVETLAVIAAITSAQALAMGLDPILFLGTFKRYLGISAPSISDFGTLLSLMKDGPSLARSLRGDGEVNKGISF